MKKYKKRSMAMVLSIALSTFLIVSIGSLSESSKNLEVKDIQRVCGMQHVRYENLNISKINEIKKDPHVKKVAGTAYYDHWNNENKLSINVLCADENVLYMENTRVIKGRFPTKSNEIAMEKWVLDRLNISPVMDQTIKIKFDENGENDFQLVGILKDRPNNKRVGAIEGFVAFNNENLKNRANHLYAFVLFDEDLNLNNEIKRLAKEIGIKDKQDIVMNEMLLDTMGQLHVINWDLVKTSIMLMVVGGMVIYSVYGISLLKRVQEYGNLRAVGTTKGQLIYIILLEIGIIYLIGILFGIFMSISCLYLLKGSSINVFTEGIYKLDLIIISNFSILLAMAVGIGASSLAGMKSLFLTMRLSPIEAMNKMSQDKNIYIHKKESFVEKRLGISNRIAYKNLKRNKRAVIFTVLTMAIGCTLFMVQAFEDELWTKNWEVYRSIDQAKEYEFKLAVNEGTPMKRGYTREGIEAMEKIPQAKAVSAKQCLYSKMKFNKKYINGKNGKNYIEYMEEEGLPSWLGDFVLNGDEPNEIIMRNTVLGLCDDDLKSLSKGLDKGKIDIEKMKNEPVAVIYLPKANEKGRLRSFDESVFKPVLNINVGDDMKVTIPKEGYENLLDNFMLLKEYEKYKEKYVDQEFTIIGITSELPDHDVYWSGTSRAPYILLSQKMFQKFSGIDTYRLVSIDMENENKKDHKILEKKLQKIAESIPGTTLQDRAAYLEERKEFQINYDLFKNAIAVVLIIISGVSIYNNISYNLFSRLREYGVMKAVGLTKIQFRKMVGFEGLLYGSICAAFSCVIALIIEIGLFIYYAHYTGDLVLKEFFIQKHSFFIVIGINIAIGYIATLGPIKQVNKIEITESIRAVE
jgi:putative ABC transport system permease protein